MTACTCTLWGHCAACEPQRQAHKNSVGPAGHPPSETQPVGASHSLVTGARPSNTPADRKVS